MKHSLHRSLLIGMLALVFGFPAWADELKIGVVEPDKVLNGTKAGKKITASLKEYVGTRQRLLESEEEDLKKMQHEVEKQSAVLSPAAKQEKEEMFRQKMAVYQRLLTQLGEEVQKKKTESLSAFTKKMEQVVKEIAEKEKIALVVEKGGSGAGTPILYSQPSINLTDRVIKALDEKGGE